LPWEGGTAPLSWAWHGRRKAGKRRLKGGGIERFKLLVREDGLDPERPFLNKWVAQVKAKRKMEGKTKCCLEGGGRRKNSEKGEAHSYTHTGTRENRGKKRPGKEI